jgi:hypothetical protein
MKAEDIREGTGLEYELRSMIATLESRRIADNLKRDQQIEELTQLYDGLRNVVLELVKNGADTVKLIADMTGVSLEDTAKGND